MITARLRSWCVCFTYLHSWENNFILSLKRSMPQARVFLFSHLCFLCACVAKMSWDILCFNFFPLFLQARNQEFFLLTSWRGKTANFSSHAVHLKRIFVSTFQIPLKLSWGFLLFGKRSKVSRQSSSRWLR